MKSRSTPKLASFGVLLLLVQLDSVGQAFDAWQTVDDFQLVAGQAALSQNIGIDETGVIFCVGRGLPATPGAGRALIRRSQDAGHHWSTVDDFALDEALPNAGFTCFAPDAGSGGHYVGGFALDGAGCHWIVRRSVDGGTTWSTADIFQYAPGFAARCASVAVDSRGTVFAAGSASPELGPGYWIVRRSRDGGTTWETVEVFGDRSLGASAQCIAFHPSAGVCVAGTVDKGVRGLWTVRRSLDRGTTWTTVDSLPYDSNASAIGVDRSGATYVAGTTGTTDTRVSWMVRSSTDGGSSWATVDEFRFYTQPNAIAAPSTLAIDASGRLHVLGRAWVAIEEGPPVHVLIRTTSTASGESGWSTTDVSEAGIGSMAIAADSSGNLYSTGPIFGVDGTTHWIVSKMEAPAALDLRRVGDQLSIAWPTNTTGVVLQSAPRLSVADWGPVTEATPALDGNRWTVAVPIGAGERYFRLGPR